jgi:hypothetical protein
MCKITERYYKTALAAKPAENLTFPHKNAQSQTQHPRPLVAFMEALALAGKRPRPEKMGQVMEIALAPSRKPSTSNFDFKADLDDLRGGYAEISRRQIGVEVHRREDPLPPHRHAGHFAARHDHHSTRIKGDLFRVDTA